MVTSWNEVLYFNDKRVHNNIYGNRGIIFHTAAVNSIQYTTISTLGNAVQFGHITRSILNGGACSNKVRACVGTYSIDYIDIATLSSTSNSFGIISVTLNYVGGGSSNGLGFFIGSSNSIQYITIATTGDSYQFGTLSTAMIGPGIGSNDYRVLLITSNISSAIDYIETNTLSNSTHFGDLPTGNVLNYVASVSDLNTVVVSGNGDTSGNNIYYITISIVSNAVDFGDLIIGRGIRGAFGNTFRGCFCGGSPYGVFNTIDYITFSNLTNAIDFGDLAIASAAAPACSGD